jgi:hypothetical protein
MKDHESTIFNNTNQYRSSFSVGPDGPVGSCHASLVKSKGPGPVLSRKEACAAAKAAITATMRMATGYRSLRRQNRNDRQRLAKTLRNQGIMHEEEISYIA